MNDSEPTPKRITLTDFIESNHKLLTILGVFTALTVFSVNLTIKPLGYILAFIYFTMTILVWLEIWSKFPAGTGSWRLFWFENIISFLMLFIIAYWLIEYRSIWKYFLMPLLFIIITGIFSVIIKKFNIFNRLFHTKPGKLKFLRYLFGVLIMIVVLFLSIYLVSFFAPPTNTFLDGLRNYLATPLP
jgi:hypothetical protein